MARITYDPEYRTTTLIFGPFDKPLAFEDVHLIAAVQARAIGHGYAVLKIETEHSVTLTAVLTAPRSQPLTRVRELVPGAVVSALVGEATAPEPH